MTIEGTAAARQTRPGHAARAVGNAQTRVPSGHDLHRAADRIAARGRGCRADIPSRRAAPRRCHVPRVAATAGGDPQVPAAISCMPNTAPPPPSSACWRVGGLWWSPFAAAILTRTSTRAVSRCFASRFMSQIAALARTADHLRQRAIGRALVVGEGEGRSDSLGNRHEEVLSALPRCGPRDAGLGSGRADRAL